MDFLTEYKKEINNKYADIAENGIQAGDIYGFIDSGSYWLNALISGSIYGGYPNSKITMIAAESGTGKTFLVIHAMKTFLDANKDGAVFLFESESAITKQFLIEQGIDIKRVLVIPVVTVQGFRHNAVTILNKYIEQKEKRPCMFVLDSMGMLSTTKEIEDVSTGSETKDMTRTQLLKATFRVLTLKMGVAKIPLLVTNHTYASMGMFSTQVVSGGSGGIYGSSNILTMSKRKVQNGKEKIGNIITCTNHKGRLTREGAKAEILIDFQTGLSRYHGMVESAISAGVWEKVGNRVLINGVKMYASAVYKNPEKFITEDVLKEIDTYMYGLYNYGSAKNYDEIETEDI